LDVNAKRPLVITSRNRKGFTKRLCCGLQEEAENPDGNARELCFYSAFGGSTGKPEEGPVVQFYFSRNVPYS
jgi:hypothetical protein